VRNAVQGDVREAKAERTEKRSECWGREKRGGHKKKKDRLKTER